MITISCRSFVVGPVEKTIKTIVTGFGWNATSDLRVDRLPERRNQWKYWSLNTLYKVMCPPYIEYEVLPPTWWYGSEGGSCNCFEWQPSSHRCHRCRAFPQCVPATRLIFAPICFCYELPSDGRSDSNSLRTSYGSARIRNSWDEKNMYVNQINLREEVVNCGVAHIIGFIGHMGNPTP